MRTKVEVTADLIERSLTTGHPRLPASLLRREKTKPGTFEEVHFETVSVNGEPVENRWDVWGDSK